MARPYISPNEILDYYIRIELRLGHQEITDPPTGTETPAYYVVSREEYRKVLDHDITFLHFGLANDDELCYCIDPPFPDLERQYLPVDLHNEILFQSAIGNMHMAIDPLDMVSDIVSLLWHPRRPEIALPLTVTTSVQPRNPPVSRLGGQLEPAIEVGYSSSDSNNKERDNSDFVEDDEDEDPRRHVPGSLALASDVKKGGESRAG